jgi:ribosomal protein S18 acetylase RimI-like enzyme
MVRIRNFRNDDPPALVALWNDALPGRSTYTLRAPGPLERFVMSKPYFDPAGLFIAEEDGAVVGFAHAGFGPNDDESALDPSRGVLCAIAVRSSHRRRGIGGELLRKSQEYLVARGSQVLHAGPHWPLCPFYFGLYGGSDMCGFLMSDASAAPFLEHYGYQVVRTTVVLQRRLDRAFVAADARFMNLRRRFDVRLIQRTVLGTWWQECVAGLLDAVEFRLEDRTTGQPVARAPIWEMEGYGCHWNAPVAGVTDVQVRSDLRRQGLAKFLLTQMIRSLQEQYFGVIEVQTPEDNPTGLALFQSLGFEQVDLGRVYRREMA